jgi:S-adenosylmethionine synthetase
MKNFTFTSESVCQGHPDKICDQISDAILDNVLLHDPNGRVAIETVVTKNKIVIAGELTSSKKVPIENIARKEIKRLGYTKNIYAFTSKSPIEILVHEQSEEIARGVDTFGAGDQGMMFGYACKDTKNFMPLPIELSHRLAQKIDEVREKNILPYLRPDGKTQVTLEYKNDVPVKVKTVVVAVPHSEATDLHTVKEDLYNKVIIPVVSEYNLEIKRNNCIVNGTGAWHIGGPAMDTGLTGRKIIVDTYGGFARAGGGCFSGKDPTKVDRSGAYAARFIAKNIIAQNLADKAEVRLAYFIGAQKPLMQEIETFGTERTSTSTIKIFADKLLDTSVEGILTGLDLKKPIYHQTASYGHFGRGIFPWEKIV